MRASLLSLLLVAGIAVTSTSCSSDSPSEPGPGGALECESRDYPCSLSEVPLPVLERTDALGDEALAMLEDGASTSAAAAFLDAQSEVAEVVSDQTAIWFRLEGGAGIWILREGAFSPESRSVPAARTPPARPIRPAFHIAGPNTEQKKALVLGPFFWQFPEYDDGPAVRDILAGTRGYEGRVTYLSNPDSLDTNVSLDSYMGWDAYQVVHLSTHGKRICYQGVCKGTLIAGLLQALLPAGSGTKAEKLHALTFQGVTYAKSEKTGREFLVLNADFFRYHYPNGLDNTFVFLNSCQSLGPQAIDLVEAIQGRTSVVFGWSESVYAGDATAAAVALYQALSERGYPAEVALEHIGPLKVGAIADSTAGAPQLAMSLRPEGGDLRIRDVIYLLDPGTGQVLTGSDLVSIDGAEDDGTPDAAPFLVRVDGVKQQLAAGMMVHVTIDDVEGSPVALAGGQRNEQDQWTVSGTLPLGYDLKQETPVEFRARLTLRDGGESKHMSGARLTGEGPIMGSEWEFKAVQTFGWVAAIPHTPYSATTTLTLRFAPGQAGSGTNPRYVITGGTVTYKWSHSYYSCTYTAPDITFAVTPEVWLDSRLIFNTTQSPVRYHGLISTFGPEFQSVEQCGEGESSTRTQRAKNVWLLLNPEDARTVSTDRRSISGTYRVTGAGGDFYIESNYTITRTK